MHATIGTIKRHRPHQAADADTLRKALLLACDRIADGPQKRHEANTADGWADVFVTAAAAGKSTDDVLASQPAPQPMTDAERAAVLAQ